MFSIEAAIFDLDGVIVDTAKYHYLAWKKLANILGIDFTLEDNERLKGVSRTRSLEIILEIGGLSISETKKIELANMKNRWYLDYIQEITPEELLPGVVSFLTHLRNHGVKTSLASASKNAPFILDRLGIFSLFDAIVDGNAVEKAKPDPEVFLLAAQKLDIAPEKSVVFEDAVAGVEAGKRAGMFVVGIGDHKTLSEADIVVRDLSQFDPSLITGEATPSEMLIHEERFTPENIELNGSKFLLGNGYMGYRGTLDEYMKSEQVACTLAGLYDRVGNAWREPVNAPNGLFTQVYYEDEPLSVVTTLPMKHTQILDMRRATHKRNTTFHIGGNLVRIVSERFISLDDIHLAGVEYRVQAEKDCHITIKTGIDADVWDINGPHLASTNIFQQDNQFLVSAKTNEGDSLVVAEVLDYAGRHEAIVMEKSILHQIEIYAEAGKEYCFHKFVSIYTSKDNVDDMQAAAMAGNIRAMEAGYRKLKFEHAHHWHKRWVQADVQIGGDPDAQLALRYCIYLLLSGAPTHTEKASIPARGLSGQTYKGAIFWDTELFMLPFFDYTEPELARNMLKYRCHTLSGARKKAAEYGYQGAFYAWESQDNDEDACTLFNVTDVFTDRPMRTYFRDKQIHISADIVHGIWQYYLITGDESIFFEGGAEVILECARFYYSYAYFKKNLNRYELLDVTGPDEYHERVSNNAFTNRMVKFTLETALWMLDFLKKKDEVYYNALIDRLNLSDTIPSLIEMNELLYVPEPDADTLVVEQFDGYRRLDDIPLATLKASIKNPNEYLGGGNGLATTTKILKQADVILMLHLFRKLYPEKVKKANWAYYEPRTEQGSTLSPSIYAMLAADIGKPDRAYEFFMHTATVDLHGNYKRYVGTLYIGGSHPASNGGAWMATIFGFGGLDFNGDTITLKPALPSKWQNLAFNFKVRGQDFHVEIIDRSVAISASQENTATCRFNIADQEVSCAPGQHLTVATD
jgi:nigerose phosphorylase